MGFGLNLSFRAGIHGTKTGLFSRKIKLVIFSRLFAKFEAAHSRPKKYAEGVRTLSTPGDAVKFLRFDGDTGNSTVCGNARMRSLFLHHINIGLTQAVFYEIFSFCYNSVLVCRLSFRAGIYGTKTGKATRKIKFVISLA